MINNPNETEYFCPQCNSKVTPEDKFCNNCGTDLGGMDNQIENNTQNNHVPHNYSKDAIKLVVAIIIGLVVYRFFLNSDSNKPFNYTSVVSNEVSKLDFCEDVDGRLNCINQGSKFNRGIVTAKATSTTSFNDDYIYVTIYRIEGEAESLYDKITSEVNPDWNITAIKIQFNEIGKYKVVFRKGTNKKIAEGIVTII